MTRKQWWLISAAVAWTAFVWINRIRNAFADDDLRGAGLVGVIVLSLSFLVLAGAVVVLAWRDRHSGAGALLRGVVGAMTAWTTAVWLVRMFDIAFLSNQEVPFIVVHVGLGVVSIALWALAMVNIAEGRSEQIPAPGLKC